ncbi:Uncharacterised protein [Bordetella pertussis]|nr:Uncharacterised protein [Bordetella pertussis]
MIWPAGTLTVMPDWRSTRSKGWSPRRARAPWNSS